METKKRHRLSSDMRELQARLLRALNGGFVAPTGDRGPTYRLRDGKVIRRKSALRIDRQLAQWENSNGHVPGGVPVAEFRSQAENPVISENLMRVLRVGMLWITLTPEERQMVVTFGRMHDESKAV